MDHSAEAGLWGSVPPSLPNTPVEPRRILIEEQISEPDSAVSTHGSPHPSGQMVIITLELKNRCLKTLRPPNPDFSKNFRNLFDITLKKILIKMQFLMLEIS